jgi:hypothetical protein
MQQNPKARRVLDRLADYSDESLLSELRRVAGIVGRNCVTLRDIETHGRCSYEVIKQRFGGLRAALSTAGIGSEEFHRNVSDDDLPRELARVWDMVLTHEGRRPHRRDMAKYKARFSEGPYYRRWGSWIRACEAVLEWEPKEGSEIRQEANTSGASIHTESRRKRPIPLRIRYAILLRDRFTCQICGRSPSSTLGLQVDVDHIMSDKDGGTLDHSNLRCLCQDCNVGKGSYSET